MVGCGGASIFEYSKRSDVNGKSMMLMTHHEQHEHCAPMPAAAYAAPLPTVKESAPAPAPAPVRSTKRHWRALRNALLAKPAPTNGNATASSISTEFFPMFPAQTSVLETANSAAGGSLHKHRHPETNFEWMQYDVSIEKDAKNGDEPADAKVVYVHEKQKGKRVAVAELLSHKVNQGVDNTGNIRTWPSEQILLSYVLKHSVCEDLYQRRNGCALHCCELGSGMAGLASLGLLAHAPVPFGRFDITDGNPLSVKNLQVCVDENIAHGAFAKSSSVRVNVDLLRWDRNASFPMDLAHQCDLLLASDCLFFEEFHSDLAHTIKQLLRPRTGRCFMLQPSRAGSMERFWQIAESQGLHVEHSSDYDAEITTKHTEYLRSRPDYVPDVHFPTLLVLSVQQAVAVAPSQRATE